MSQMLSVQHIIITIIYPFVKVGSPQTPSRGYCCEVSGEGSGNGGELGKVGGKKLRRKKK